MKRPIEAGKPRAILPVAAVLAAAVALGSGAPRAAGTDGWPSFRGDPALTGVARCVLPDRLSVLWTFQAGVGIESTAAIDAGSVYVGAMDGRLHALSLADGSKRWSYEAAGPVKSSPAVLGGTLYVGDETGTLHAIEPRTGARKWTYKAEGAISSSPAVAGGRVLFGSYDNNLYALDAATGALAWKVETAGYVHAAPAVFEGPEGTLVVAAGCDGFLRIVRAKDGAEIRRVSLGAYAAASPAIAAGRAYLGTFGNRVLGVDLAAGSLLWSFEDPDRQFPFYASAAVRDGLVVAGGRDRTVRAFEAATGKVLWTWAAGARVDASPVLSGERAWVATTAGLLAALDLKTGEPVFRLETGSGFSASPAVAGGRLVLGASGGILYALGPSPEGGAKP